MINEADASIDVLRVKPIDQRTRIDRCCELYNVSRADGCEAGGVVGWRRGVWREKGGEYGGSAGSLRCAASGGRGDSLLGPKAPRERIRTCPDSQPPSSRQQGDEPPQQPLPPPPPQLKVWLSCRLERNKTQSTTTLSPYAQGLGHAHTHTHTSWDTSTSTLAPFSKDKILRLEKTMVMVKKLCLSYGYGKGAWLRE